MKPVKKLALSGMFIALYIAIIAMTAGISFGQVQVRLANTLYALPYMFPFLIVPTGLAVVMSNLIFGGLGLLDIIGGFFVGVIVASLVALLGKFKAPVVLTVIPVITVPALLVPLWLSYLIKVPYTVLLVSVGLGQVIPAILGVIIIKLLRNKIQY